MLKNLVSIILIICVIFTKYLDTDTGDLFSIHFLNVGQGDAILVITPDNRKILIDGGPSDDVYEEISKILPFWDKKIDLLVASHGDADHISGLIEISKRFEIGSFVHNGKQKNTIVYRELLSNLMEKSVPISLVDSESDMVIGCCTSIDYIWPIRGGSQDYTDNDLSVSMILNFINFEVYLAGDLSFKYEEEAVKNLNYDIEILKASHHGSKSSTSSELISKLKPEIAVISSGEGNKYNHPSPEVLDIFRKENVFINRTDEEGTLSYYSDGINFWMK